jgi:valyl-tRNA synthetase
VLGLPAAPAATEPAEALDLAMLAGLEQVAAEATAALEAADWTAALERTEAFFWTFCDDYLELVKDRAYGSAGDRGAASARAALRTGVDVLLRLLAPYLPFAAEEVWSWWRDGSVHRAAWPERVPAGRGADRLPLEAAGQVLVAVRRAKSQARRPLRTPVTRVVVSGPTDRLAAVRTAEADLAAAGRVALFAYREQAPPLTVDVELAPENSVEK